MVDFGIYGIPKEKTLIFISQSKYRKKFIVLVE